MTEKLDSAPVRIVLAGAPMGKQRVRFTHAAGRPYTPEKTINYEGRLAHAGQIAMGDRPLLDGPLCVDLELRMPINLRRPHKWRLAAMAGKIFPTKKPDLDNCAKMLDALNLVVWTDDAQIVDMHVRKVYHENPSFIATIWPKFEGVFA